MSGFIALLFIVPVYSILYLAQSPGLLYGALAASITLFIFTPFKKTAVLIGAVPAITYLGLISSNLGRDASNAFLAFFMIGGTVAIGAFFGFRPGLTRFENQVRDEATRHAAATADDDKEPPDDPPPPNSAPKNKPPGFGKRKP